MAKSKQQKVETIESLGQGLKGAKAVVFANFQGLKVSEAEELRGLCRQNDIQVLAAKKSLLKRAFAEAGLTDTDPTLFQGGVASFMGTGDEVAPAKIVSTFAKTHEVVAVFGGVLEGRFIDAAMVKNLASLPSKTELLAKVVGSINAPVSGFVNVLSGNLRNLVSVLNNIKEAKA
ncbi:MAG TPA: 50S ribosomal protein L10 [Patescibacteria group bacterium]|nr:50S ribosomal protein L10 [Patescibacteria group bacterium]